MNEEKKVHDVAYRVLIQLFPLLCLTSFVFILQTVVKETKTRSWQKLSLIFRQGKKGVIEDK
jgi:hypothetical protein